MHRRAALAIVLALLPGLTPAAGEADDARSLLRRLAAIPGVPGYEEPVRAAIRAALPSWAAPETDNLGNLTVTTGAGSPHLLLVAHMDEPGYVVTEITERGYLKVQRLARIPLPALFDQFHAGQPVILVARKGTIPGVVVIPSTHLWRGDESPLKKGFRDEDLLLDVGARSAAEARGAGADLLDAVAIARRIVDLAGGRLAGPAMDDRAGCVALLRLLDGLEPVRLHGTLTVAFSAQEVMGGRGAERLAGRFQPDQVLVVDAPLPAPGPTAVPDKVVSGAGPVIGAPGAPEVASQALYLRVAGTAAGLGIPLQHAAYAAAGDGRPFTGKAEVLSLGVPVLYPGTPGQVVDPQDILSLARLLKAVVEGGKP